MTQPITPPAFIPPPTKLWGIWIYKKGWWKVPASGLAGFIGRTTAYVDTDPDVVDHYAAWIGGRRMPIDASLERSEKELLANEKKKDK